ncbi:MAG: hypothetical protein J6Q10_00800, partial [Clostridia bacterium]|nr:hypothetical protein [Clostridia bacterium]
MYFCGDNCFSAFSKEIKKRSITFPQKATVPMIVGEIRRYLRDNTSIRVSRSLRDIAYKALNAKERLVNANSKEPTIDEIATEMGMKREEVSAALDAIMDPVSLYEPVYHDGGDAIFVMDQVKDEK